MHYDQPQHGIRGRVSKLSGSLPCGDFFLQLTIKLSPSALFLLLFESGLHLLHER